MCYNVNSKTKKQEKLYANCLLKRCTALTKVDSYTLVDTTQNFSLHNAGTDAALWTLLANSWCDQPLAVWTGGPVEHETDHGERDHGIGYFGQVFVIPGQTAPTTEPAERSFDNSAAWQDGEALCSRWTADDDQHKAE